VGADDGVYATTNFGAFNTPNIIFVTNDAGRWSVKEVTPCVKKGNVFMA